MRCYCRQWLITAVLVAPLLAAAQAGNTAALLADGDHFLQAGDTRAALQAYTRALHEGADFSHDSLHSRNLGRCYLSTTRPDYSQAARWLQQSLKIESSDDARLLLARAQTGMGAHEASAESYRVLALAHPQNPDYVLGCARALRQSGKVDGALEWLRAALERSPGLTSVRVEYGRLLAFQKQLPEAKRQFETVLASDPENLGAQIGLAKVTSWQGDQGSALRQYDGILRRNAGLYDALVGKAFALLWSGHSAEARPLLQQAARRHPEDEDVREALLSLGVAVPERARKTSGDEAPATQIPASRPVSKAASPARIPEKNSKRTAARAGDGSSHGVGSRIVDQLLTHKMAWAAGILGSLSLMLVVLMGTIPRRSRPATVQVMRIILPLRDTGLAKAVERRIKGEKQAAAAAREVSRRASSALPVTNADTAASAGKDRLAGAKIVLIGSNRAVLQFESRVLTKAEAEVTGFESWHAAVACLSSHEPDLLVLNALTADGWTALTMCAWLSANRPELVRRTMVTISVHDKDADEFCRAHMGSFLHQPFGVNEFLGAVGALLSQRNASPAVPQQPAAVQNATPA